jgi:hypothetical protein
MGRTVTAGDLVVLLLAAALAGLAWTWLLTWVIARWGGYEDDDE